MVALDFEVAGKIESESFEPSGFYLDLLEQVIPFFGLPWGNKL